MSPRVRQLSGSDVIRALKHFGFEVVATRGSHAKLRRLNDRGERETLTIPLHASLATGTVVAIFRQACRYIAAGELGPHFYSD